MSAAAAAAGTRRWRALLLGATGQLGFELARVLAPLAEVTATGGPSGVENRFDVTDAGAVDRLVEAARPDIIVNACAYTAVDAAETDLPRARAVNADGPALLAAAAARSGAVLVHYSTDYVFDGDTETAYREPDATAPVNAYGLTKLEGEQAIVASGAVHLVLRTGWLFGAHGRNFPAAILAAAGRGRTLRVVDDQTGCPTSARLLAELTGQILAQARPAEGARGIQAARAWLAARQGIYHAVGAGSCTWFTLAREVLDRAGAPASEVGIEPVSTETYGAQAPRPRRSVLDCSRLGETFGLVLPHWREHVRQVLAERHAALSGAPG